MRIPHHELLSIIKIENQDNVIKKKQYVCDLNNLNFIAIAERNNKHDIKYICQNMEFKFGIRRFGSEEYYIANELINSCDITDSLGLQN